MQSKLFVLFLFTDNYPKLQEFPKLGNPEVTQNNEVRFPCTVPYRAGEADVAFEVRWTVDGAVLNDTTTGNPVLTTLTGDSRVAYLDAKKLQGNLGKDVCY